MSLKEYNMLQVTLIRKYNLIGHDNFHYICTMIAEYRSHIYSIELVYEIEKKVVEKINI